MCEEVILIIRANKEQNDSRGRPSLVETNFGCWERRRVLLEAGGLKAGSLTRGRKHENSKKVDTRIKEAKWA